jgi:hypothetical protein
MAGIRLILEEIRDLRRDWAEYRVKAGEDRRKADEDRRKADEDRRKADEERVRMEQRFQEYMRGSREYMRESREAFRQYAEEAARREEGMSKALAVIGHIGGRILDTLNKHTAILEENGRLPARIARSLDVKSNGK